MCGFGSWPTFQHSTAWLLPPSSLGPLILGKNTISRLKRLVPCMLLQLSKWPVSIP